VKRTFTFELSNMLGTQKKDGPKPVPFQSAANGCLEREPCSELNNTRIGSPRNLAEERARAGYARVVELRVVEDVEEVPSDLEFHSLTVEVGDLRYRDVGVDPIRTAEGIAAKRPIRAEGRIKGGRAAVI